MQSEQIIKLVKLYRAQHGTTPPAQWLIDKTGLTVAEVKEALSKTNPAIPGPSAVYKPIEKAAEKAVEKPLPTAPKEAKQPRAEPEVKRAVKVPLSVEKIPKRGFSAFRHRIPSMEQMVLHFADGLQYFGFMVAGIVDVGLAVFFYWSLGADPLSKAVMGGLGLVQTTSKLWGWTYSVVLKKAGIVAVAASLMSVFGVTSILRAEFELQATSTIAANTRASAKVAEQSETEIIQGQITRQQATVVKAETARDKFDTADESQLPMYRTNKKLADEANGTLTSLRYALTKAQDREAAALATKESARAAPEPVPVIDTTIRLDAWSIFRQWTELDMADKPRVLAYWVTLFFACLLELIIWSVTPKKKPPEITLKGQTGT